MLGETLAALPELRPILHTLYAGPATLHWYPREDPTVCVPAATCIDQGCPLSPVLLSFGLRAVLRRARELCGAAGIPAEAVAFWAYIDDLYTMCPAEHATAVLGAVRDAAETAG